MEFLSLGARIDYKQNKVIVGVASNEVVEHVRAALARLGIPGDAVGIEVLTREGRGPSR